MPTSNLLIVFGLMIVCAVVNYVMGNQNKFLFFLALSVLAGLRIYFWLLGV